MPYARRQRWRKRGRGRKFKPFWDKKYSVRDIAMSAWKATKYIKGLVNSERMKYDKTAVVNPNTTGAVSALVDMAQGDTDANRHGNSIFVRALGSKLQFRVHSLATTTFIRVIFFIDSQQVGDTNPALSDLLESVTVYSPLNSATVGRFKILKDIVICLDNVATPSVFRKVFLSMRHHVRYNGNAATDIQKGAIYIGYLSSEATNTPEMTHYTRISYHDN